MIKYRLQCTHGHEFEGWFASSASYDAQVAAGQLTCPECNSREVGKSIMAPNVAVRARSDVAVPDDEAPARYRNLVREVARVLTASSEDVGARFPEEARKIHYREVAAARHSRHRLVGRGARAGGGGRRDHGAAAGCPRTPIRSSAISVLRQDDHSIEQGRLRIFSAELGFAVAR